MLWFLAAFLGLSLVNPLCMVVSFCFCMGMDIYQPTSTNVYTFDAPFFPVYLTVGMLTLLVQLLAVYGAARIVHRGQPVQLARVAQAFLSAQKPFLFLALALPLLLGDVEGNALAFGAIFAAPFVVVAAVFAARSLRKKLATATHEPSNESAAFAAPVGGATAIAACASLAVIWTYGPGNGFGEWLAWRSDTPQYAIRAVTQSLQAGDMASLQAYVDVDAILGQLAAVGGPSRAEFAKALSQRQLRDKGQGGIRHKEWSIGADTDNNPLALRLASPHERDGLFAAKIHVQSEVTGESFPLVLAMQPSGGRYRITRVNNLEDIARFLEKQREKAQRVPALAQEAKTKAQSLAVVRLHSLRQENAKLRCEFDVVNKGAATIRLLECAIVLRNADTGAMTLTETLSLDFDPDGLSAGRATCVEASSEVSPVVARNVKAGRLAATDVVPVAIVYADQRVDLAQLPL